MDPKEKEKLKSKVEALGTRITDAALADELAGSVRELARIFTEFKTVSSNILYVLQHRETTGTAKTGLSDFIYCSVSNLNNGNGVGEEEIIEDVHSKFSSETSLKSIKDAIRYLEKRGGISEVGGLFYPWYQIPISNR